MSASKDAEGITGVAVRSMPAMSKYEGGEINMEVLLSIVGGIVSVASIAQVAVLVNLSGKVGSMSARVDQHDTQLKHIESACPLCPKER